METFLIFQKINGNEYIFRPLYTMGAYMNVETLLGRVWGFLLSPRRGQAASLHSDKRCKNGHFWLPEKSGLTHGCFSRYWIAAIS